MFGIDSPELLVIAIVALVVIGPKELPGLLRSWGKWMAQMRGMASEFRGHVDEMVRQSELDEVKKQLTGAATGLDVASLDPTKEIKSAIQEGMAEGEKALAEAKAAGDNPLAEPDSAPQIAAEPVAAEPTLTEAVPQIEADTTAAVTSAEIASLQITSEPVAPVVAGTVAISQPVPAEDKPAKAAAE